MPIEVKELSYTYNEGLSFASAALSEVSFRVEDGSFTAVIGHTGSGKSTLVQLLIGLLKPQRGTVLVDGEDIFAENGGCRRARQKIGLVFQYPEYQLFEETVAADVAFGPKNQGLSGEELDACVADSLALAGLPAEEYGERSPFELSGGQKRRAAIAGVLAMRPKFLILDEPAAGLDPKGRRDLLELIRGVQKQRGSGILLISHNMDEVARMAEQVLVMDGGRLAMQGSPAEVFAQGEALRAMGLGLPAAAAFAERLRARGFALPPVLTTEDAAAALLKVWAGSRTRRD